MQKADISEVNKPFFLGIGGIGISAIARMFLLEGKKVQGSDMNDSEIIGELRKAGAEIRIGQSADLVPNDTDLVVYTIAIKKYNPELLKEIAKRGVPMVSYPEMLGMISKSKYTIAISGTHGKTTTTAMIAKILMDAGFDPTVIVGSLLKESHSNFIAGKGKYLVVEACEYERSFLNIHPTIAVITNIDNDHLDYYKDISEITKAFSEFIARIPKNGYAILNDQDKNSAKATGKFSGKSVDYGEFREDFHLKIPGRHNKENAAAALAVSHVLGIDKKKAMKSLEEFAGTWRRFEYKGKTEDGIIVYDDYGHHPTEIRATLSGARELYPKEKITVVFQPHLYSRTKLLLEDFARAFHDADRVIVLPIYAAREENDPSVSSEVLAEKIKKNSVEAVPAADFTSAEKSLRGLLKAGEILITLGAGEANKVGDALISHHA